MNFSVNNKKIKVGSVKVGGVGNASLFLIGDAEVITSSSIFDTPANSLLYTPRVPIFSSKPETIEFQEFFNDE